MSENTCMIRKHPDTGLMYVIEGDEAVIVGCTQLNQAHVDIPAVIFEGTAQYRVTAIGEAAFSYMSALQTISLPVTLTRIDQSAFEASGLTEIQLHNGVVTIARYAFFRCAQLRRVVLPERGLQVLPEMSLGECDALAPAGVINLNRIPDARKCGLPIIAEADAPGEERQVVTAAQELLQQGVARETEERWSEAATYYMQAHGLREQVAYNPDLQARVADLNAIAEAEYRLGVLLKLGLAPAKDPDGTPRPDALTLLQTVADSANIADAMYHTGDLLAGGFGVPTDPAEALRYLRNAARLGHERACLDLAFIYLDGTLDQPSREKAVSYLRKCVELQGPHAQIAAAELAGMGFIG